MKKFIKRLKTEEVIAFIEKVKVIIKLVWKDLDKILKLRKVFEFIEWAKDFF